MTKKCIHFFNSLGDEPKMRAVLKVKDLTPMLLPSINNGCPGKACSKGSQRKNIPFFDLLCLVQLIETYGDSSHRSIAILMDV
jgi:hypothetical protein